MPTDFFVANLYDKCLLDHIKSGHDRLQIVSGYASPRMLAKLIHARNSVNTRAADRFQINLLIGMASSDGMSSTDLESYRSLVSASANVDVRVRLKPMETHSKVYVWSRGAAPAVAYVGSANFSQTGLGVAVTSRVETMAAVDPYPANKFASDQFQLGTSIHDPRVEELTRIWQPRATPSKFNSQLRNFVPMEEVTLPLVATGGPDRGQVPTRSGLNWGNREGRDPDQAYIPVPVDVQRSDFFPPVGRVFTVTTSDGNLLQMVRAQANGKALHSLPSNAEIGKYFRSRLGVPFGYTVQTDDLISFGTDSVLFEKFSTSAFRMRFAPDLGFNFQPR